MHEMFDRILSLTVGDVMTTEPVTVNASASMAEVSHLFARHALHSAPVVDDTGKCVGMITATDFVKRNDKYCQSEGQPHELVEHSNGILAEPRSYDYVSDCMTREFQSILPEAPLITAARAMTDAHLHVMPVLEQDKPVGIVSNLDVVAALVNAFDEARNEM